MDVTAQSPLGANPRRRWHPRNWNIPVKLAVVALVPIVLAIVLGGLRIGDKVAEAATLERTAAAVEAQADVAAVLGALERERFLAAVFAAQGRPAGSAELQEGFAATDAAREQAVADLAGLDVADEPVDVQRQQGLQAMDRIAGLREFVTGSTGPAASVIVRYNEIIEPLTELDDALLRTVDAADLDGLATALAAVGEARGQASLQRAHVVTTLIAGFDPVPDTTEIRATEARLDAALGDFRAALDAEQRVRYAGLLSGPANVDRERLALAVLNAPGVTPPDAATAAEVYDAMLAELAAAQEGVRDELTADTAALLESASNAAGINSVLLMLSTGAAAALVLLVARALIRSLRVLRASALDVAERRLPLAVENMRSGEAPDVTVDPVPLDSTDEVGQVARAFDAVHGQAIRLAAEQAALQTNVSAMFVNLSRRSQALVERQLQLIEQLESNEQDPDQLSNLFQLDHLATRMRRNSENLLVLAGTDLAKRNIAPVPMVDVLRAAVSEIEQYQRIVVQSPPTTTIVGRAASDLVHLLAELLDNATNFSPPDSQVVMSTARTAEGAILVEIADRGVGMIDYELADVNRRLGGPSTVDVSASRRMGLFVVGRLGTRHGIQVQLDTSSADGPGSGLTASVTVPAHLVPTVEGERPGPARVDAAPTPSAFDVPPQRAAVNGSGRPASLSALVAGTDGPMMSPPSAFDPGPGGNGSPPFPSTNGSGPPPLPTRKPGAALDPADGFGRSGDRDGTSSVAEQARQDQLAAERAEADRGSESDSMFSPAVPPAAPDDQGAADDRGDGPEQDAGSQPHVAAHSLGAPVTGQIDAADDDARGGDTRDGGEHEPGEHEPADEDRPDVAATDTGRDTDPDGAADDAPDDGAARPAPSRHTPWPNSALPHGNGNGNGARPDTERPAPRPSPLPQRRPSPRPAQAAADTAAEQGHTDRTSRGPIVPPTTPMPMVGRLPEPVQPPAVRPVAAAPAAADREQQPREQQRSDGLFAPNVPAVAEPEAPAPETMAPRPPDQGTGFEMGETTPIFEEIASAWFRSNRPLPVEYEDEAPPAPSPRARPRPAAARPQPPYQQQTFTPQAAPPVAPPRRRPPTAELPAPAPAPAPVVEETSAEQAGFASTADEGWRAANAAAPTEQADDLTSAGLPKRRPRARLVPGSAGSAVLAPPVSPARSAESVRGRLASYQQGVRQGRESRYRGDTGAQQGDGLTEPANAGGNHDEERP